MTDIIKLLLAFVRDCFRSPEQLKAEIIVLRHQLNVLQRKSPKKPQHSGTDRPYLYAFIGSFRGLLGPSRSSNQRRYSAGTGQGFGPGGAGNHATMVVGPRSTRNYAISYAGCVKENALWGAPRIHGELLKLGFDVAQSTVSKYMLRGRKPPSQGWKTFLRNHADGIAAVDFLVVPTLTFECLFAFIVLGVGRRKICWIGVTTNPTAQWLGQQITEAFPWDSAPKYLIRDNDRSYGETFKRRLHAMGIRNRPTSFRSPWQNDYAERVIGSIRRDCLDHVIVRDEAHLRRVLDTYSHYYNATRTHLSLGKDSPNRRSIQPRGSIIATDVLGGLHHQYARI